MRRLVLAAAPLLALAASPAYAASWSSTRAYDAAPAACHRAHPSINCFGEPAPRVAVGATGAAVAAWTDLRFRVRAATTDRPRHFGAATTLTANGRQPTTAIAPDGTATVAWTDRTGTLRFARRAKGKAFGAAHRLAPRGSKEGDDFAKAAAQPDGSVVVIYQSAFRGSNGQYATRLRTVTIGPTGRPGPPVTLGRGSFDHDSTRVAADGTLVACCVSPSPPATPDEPPVTSASVLVHRPGAGFGSLSTAPIGDDEVETVYGDATSVALGTIAVSQGGDAGVLGVPGVARTGAGGTLSASLRAPVVDRDRALAPNVTIDGAGRSVLLFQEKDRAAPFSRDAPVYASVAAPGASALRTRQKLDAGLAYEPAVRPLGTGAIGAWQSTHGRWRIVLETAGRFAAVAAPRGPGPSIDGEDFNFNRDLETNGGYAVLAWTSSDGAVRLSERG